MTNICKGICTREIYFPKKVVRNIKNSGYKRCSKCMMCLMTEETYCPCCRVRMKISPNNNQARKRHAEEKYFSSTHEV